MIYLLGKILVFLIVSVIIYYVVTLYLLHKKYQHIPGPPLDSFLFGHGPSIMKHVMNGGHYFSYVLQIAKQYRPVFRLIVQNQVTVYTTHPAAVKELMVGGHHRKPEEVYGQLSHIFGSRFLGDGLLTQSDHRIKGLNSMRTKIQHQLMRSGMKRMMTDMNDAADALVTKLSNFSDGKTKVKMFDEFKRMTTDLIGKVTCGMDINSINIDNTPFSNAFHDVGVAIIERGRSPLLPWNPLNLLYIWRIRRKCEFLRKLFFDIIAERKAAIEREDYVPEDILTHMMQTYDNIFVEFGGRICQQTIDIPMESNCAPLLIDLFLYTYEAVFIQQEGEDVEPEDLLDNLLTFFLAGQEASSSLLSFMVICLGRYPHILHKLRKEIDLQIGEKPYIDVSDITNLPYLDMVMKETLRMNGPSPATYRQVDEDYEIDGYTIPKGTTVCLSMYVLSHHEDYFDEPTKFDPERFNPKNDNRVDVYSYFPFSLGPRVCIGKHFAEMETKVTLIKLVQRFDFILDPNQNLGIEEGLVHQPRDGALCMLALRGQADL